MENMRKHRGIKLVKTEAGRSYLISEPNYHTRAFFSENVLEIEMNNRNTIHKSIQVNQY